MVLKNHQSRFHDRVPLFEKYQKLSKRGVILIFKLVFHQNKWLEFFRQDLNDNLFTFVGIIFRWHWFFFPVVESGWTRNVSVCCLSWHLSIFELKILQLYPLPVSINVSIKSFSLEAEHFVSKSKDVVSSIRYGALINKNLQKCF